MVTRHCRSKTEKKVKTNFCFQELINFKALICFGWTGDIRKTCEIFDGSTTVSTFASDWTHQFGGLGLYKNQPASVGCFSEKNQKAETLSASGWTALPDHPK